MKYLLLLTVTFATPLLAHEAHHQTPAAGSANPAVPSAAVQAYREAIEPILRQKCFDCHSTKTRYPWYYKLPGARQLIDYDTREAKEHLDMTDGFPFKGHHSTEEQLKSLRKVVEKNQMPLWRYRFLHPGSGLTNPERGLILDWIGNR